MTRSSSLVIRLRLGPSRILSRLVPVVYGGAVACAYVADVPGTISHVIAALAVWFMARDLRRYAWLSSADAVVELRRQADGGWELLSRGGRVVRASVRPRGYAHPWIVALVFRIHDGRTVRVPVAGDMVEREVFRVLRMTVRTGR